MGIRKIIKKIKGNRKNIEFEYNDKGLCTRKTYYYVVDDKVTYELIYNNDGTVKYEEMNLKIRMIKMGEIKMINNFKNLAKNNNIEDVYLTGFVDIEDGIAQFYPDLRFIYFEINSKFIEFESINQYSKLRIKVVSSVNHNFEIDKDMTKGKASVSEIILTQDGAIGNCIDNIKFYNLEKKQEELICDAIEIKLKNEQVIFLDPSFYFGINIGGYEQKKIWQSNLYNNLKIDKTYMKISD